MQFVDLAAARQWLTGGNIQYILTGSGGNILPSWEDDVDARPPSGHPATMTSWVGSAQLSVRSCSNSFRAGDFTTRRRSAETDN